MQLKTAIVLIALSYIQTPKKALKLLSTIIPNTTDLSRVSIIGLL